MRKLIASGFACMVMMLYCHAQVGGSAIGAGMQLGFTPTGQGLSLGKSVVAASVKCNAVCVDIYPVTGLKLQGTRPSKDFADLSWFTLLEVNNKGFYVQRSFNTSGAFKTTGFVAGSGNSYQKKKYAFRDTNNYTGITYYRLQQMDKDGQINYSNIISVKGINNGRLVIYPNPARNQCTLQLPEGFATAVTQVTLSDVNGKTVYQKTYSAIGGGVIYLKNLSVLKAGTYIIAVNNGNANLYGKLSMLN